MIDFTTMQLNLRFRVFINGDLTFGCSFFDRCARALIYWAILFKFLLYDNYVEDLLKSYAVPENVYAPISMMHFDGCKNFMTSMYLCYDKFRNT